MHNLIIGSTNIKNYVIEGTYKMDSVDKYESWEDGNFRQHRVIVTKKISGSFDVVCSNKTGDITLHDFYNIFAGAQSNGVIMASVYVTNTGDQKTINAYYTLTNKEHKLLADGTFLDKITVSLEER